MQLGSIHEDRGDVFVYIFLNLNREADQVHMNEGMDRK
jgi:hypothetical protein